MQSIDVETRCFGLRCTHLWLFAGIGHIGLTALCLTAIELSGRVAEPVFIILMCLMPWFYWVVYGLKYRLSLSASVLGWMNMSGAQCFLSWLDIEKAEAVREWGFPLLKVWSKTQGGPWWIPLHVKNRDLLPDALRETAGEANPVTIAIANLNKEIA